MVARWSHMISLGVYISIAQNFIGNIFRDDWSIFQRSSLSEILINKKINLKQGEPPSEEIEREWNKFIESEERSKEKHLKQMVNYDDTFNKFYQKIKT